MIARYYSKEKGARWHHPQPDDPLLKFYERWAIRVIYGVDKEPVEVAYIRYYASEHEHFCMACREIIDVHAELSMETGEIVMPAPTTISSETVSIMLDAAEIKYDGVWHFKYGLTEFTRDGWKGETYERTDQPEGTDAGPSEGL